MDARLAALRGRLRTIAVTGTNGKTTTATMIAAMIEASGEPCARVTTLGTWVAGARVGECRSMTSFARALERAVADGVRTVAIEVTSRSLAAGFARRWPPDVAVFTNLSHDHLDRHGSPEAYLAAKAQLFLALPPGGTAVLNADDPASALLDEVLPPTTRRAWYAMAGAGGAELASREVSVSAAGTEIALVPSPLADSLGGRLLVPVLGRVHAANALAASLAAHAAGYDAGAIRDALGSFRGVAGRFELVARDPFVVVDYAHTPDALKGSLETARVLAGPRGEVWCVFGCGGDRDRGKRPEMGRIADEIADRVVLTNDNPRSEAAEAVAAEIRRGAAGRAEWVEELDRRAAIWLAVARARAADVVLIAGKGHEIVQEVGEVALPFSDVEVARAACRARA